MIHDQLIKEITLCESSFQWELCPHWRESAEGNVCERVKTGKVVMSKTQQEVIMRIIPVELL